MSAFWTYRALAKIAGLNVRFDFFFFLIFGNIDNYQKKKKKPENVKFNFFDNVSRSLFLYKNI